jgi:hypothetical protein
VEAVETDERLDDYREVLKSRDAGGGIYTERVAAYRLWK